MADTIHALASAPGKAGVAVVRLSGPRAFGVANRLMTSLPEPGTARLRRLVDRAGGLIDEALVIVFPEGASFTGEPTVEFQTHGSMAVVSRLSDVLSSFDGVRRAEAGEFTRRALLNDRLSLVQVEGLSDLIEAETEKQREQALRGFSGALASLVETWRADLVHAASLLEAAVDFSDEDVPVDVTPEVSACIESLVEKLTVQIQGFGAAERIRSGFEVAIVGPPNAGKSTLLNAIAGRDVAITSEIAGTTRDVIEVRTDLSGLVVSFLDTAGIRATEDAVEQIGVTRARDRAEAADLRIHLVAPGDEPIIPVKSNDIVIAPKSDLHGGSGVSGLTGAGVQDLLSRVRDLLSERVAGAGMLTWDRHLEAVTEALTFLASAKIELSHGPDNYVIVSEEIRSAIRRLDALIGRVDVEDLLDEIFSRFCIGK